MSKHKEFLENAEPLIGKIGIIRRFLFWLVFNAPLGKLAPWVFGLAIGSKPVKVEKK